MRQHRSLAERWYDPSFKPWLTRPLSALFAQVVRCRRKLYQQNHLRMQALPVPVIVVGNITVGGTGKTPLVMALVEHLRRSGFQPGVVSRGYGGKIKHARVLPAAPDPLVYGDEPSMIRTRTGVPTAVGRQRVQAARILLAQHPMIDVLVADDGLQHYALARDVEICVIDGVRRFGNAMLLPSGPLREPLQRLQEVDYCIVNGHAREANELSMQLEQPVLVCMSDHSRHALRHLLHTPVHAVAGIGYPPRFFEQLRAADLEIIPHAFADHHAYTPHDLDFGDEHPIIMTEKDAIKCRRFAHENMWYVEITARLPQPLLTGIDARLRELHAPACSSRSLGSR